MAVQKIDDGRHEKFQFGTNPMKMTSFEKACVLKEELERELATKKYVYGIQGKDGGCFVHDQVKEQASLPLAGRQPYSNPK